MLGNYVTRNPNRTITSKLRRAVVCHYPRCEFISGAARAFVLVQRLNQISDRRCKFARILLNDSLLAKLHPTFFGFA